MTRPDVTVMRDLLAKGWGTVTRIVGDLAPYALGFLGVAIPAATRGHPSTESYGFWFGGIAMVLALASAETRGRDRGRADRITGTTVNVNMQLADGYVIVRDDSALIAAEDRHG